MEAGQPFSTSPASMCAQGLSLVSVVLEFEVEAAARLEGVKVERPGLVPSSPLLVLWVQRVLAGVELLSHFWKEKGEQLKQPSTLQSPDTSCQSKSAPDLGRSGLLLLRRCQ